MAAEKVMTRENAEGATERARRGLRSPWPILAVNFALMTIILVTSVLYSRRQISQIETEKMDELRAIATLKKDQIETWLQEILDDGRFLRSTLNFSSLFHESREIHQQREKRKTVAAWILAIQNFEGFAAIRFLDNQGRLLWPPGSELTPPDPEDIRIILAVLAANEVSLSDLYYSRLLGRINLDLRIPIDLNSGTGHQHYGALILSINPGQALYPMIQSWPTASPSAETLLIRREGNEVVYLNDLRHRKNTALKLRLPVDKKELPAARAARGEVGFVTGPDYRGVAVLADIQRIPGTSWSLIAKIDQDEVRNLISRQERVMLPLIVAVILLIAFSTAYFWRQQQITQLRQLVETDSALHQSEERYRLLIENQGEGIGLVDTADRFVFANPAGHEIFGVPPGMLIGRSLNEFLRATESDKIRQKTNARLHTGKETYEMNMVRPDGKERVLQLTVTPRFAENGQFSGTFGIFRDITERKRDEEKIIKMLAEKELLLKEVHHRVKNNMMVISSLLQIQVQRVNDQKTIAILQESQNRIHAMMTIYEKLYRTADLTHINLGEYFSELTRSLFAAYNVRPEKIGLETAISDIALNIDQTIPCGLIINELVSNTLKYAFPGDRQGRIRIEFGKMDADNDRGTARRAPTYALTVANDGVPLPAGFDITKSAGFGLQLVIMLAGQLGGTLKTSSGAGTEFQVTFPANQTKEGGADT